MTATTPIRTSAVLATAGLPTLKRDPILAPGIKGLFDFDRAYVRQDRTSFAVNDKFRNLMDGGEDATALSPIGGIAGGGLVQDSVADAIQLPNDWRWPATQNAFAVCLWAAISNTGYPASTSVGIIGDSGSANQFWLGATSDASGNVSDLNANIAGTQIYAGGRSGVRQFVLAFQRPTPTTRRVAIYSNTARVTQTDVAGGALAAPSTDTVKVGRGAGDLLNSFLGRVYRTWAVDLDVYGVVNLENLIVADYLANSSRFTA